MRKPLRLISVIIIALLIGEAAYPPIALSWAYDLPSLPPPRTGSNLKELVQELLEVTTNTTDTDSDGLPDIVETMIGTDLNNTDSDFDRVSDYHEIWNGTLPWNPDSNGDDFPDYFEIENVISNDIDGDNVTNAWDFDNDGDGVNDGVDTSPLARSTVNSKFHFDIKTNGKPLYINFQLVPENPDHLKLIYQYWDWPQDDQEPMKDLNNSARDLKLLPILNVSANALPDQASVLDYGIGVSPNSMQVTLFPVWDYGNIVAFGGKIYYPQPAPIDLSLDAELVWRVIGKSDEKIRALNASNGLYVSAIGGEKAIANSSEVGIPETLILIELSGPNVALMTTDNHYLSVDENDTITASGIEIGDSETFEVTRLDGDKIQLKACNGQNVSLAGDGTLIAADDPATNTFILEDLGFWPKMITLATYKEDFMFTGFSIEENYGSDVALFYSDDVNHTVAANLLMAYDYLRNSTTHVPDMPALLEDYNLTIADLSSLKSHKDEALHSFTNDLIPSALNTLPENRVLPMIAAFEDRMVSIEMSEVLSGDYIIGDTCQVDLTLEEIVTMKGLQTNWYNTSNNRALEAEEIIGEILEWGLNETAAANLVGLVTAWHGGEQTITSVGSSTVVFDVPERSLIPGYVKDISKGLKGSNKLRQFFVSVWKNYRFLQIKKLLRNLRKSGWSISVKGSRDWVKVTRQAYRQTAKSGLSSSKFWSRLGKAVEIIGYVLVLVDVGFTFYSLFSIIDGVENPIELNNALLKLTMQTAYMAIVFNIGVIPGIGWLIAGLIAVSDAIGGWSDKLFDWLVSVMSRVTSQVTPNIEIIGSDIAIIDSDSNGLDVGDRIEYESRLKGIISGGDSSLVSSSFIRPYLDIASTYAYSAGHLYPPYGTYQVPNISPDLNRTYGPGWKTEEYDSGVWIEPNIGWPNLPVNIQLKAQYHLYYRWEHFVWMLFYWKWCQHKGFSDGTSTLNPPVRLYFDVLPSNIEDFVSWSGITPLDHDGDGLEDSEESRSDPWRYDTDADGLNDKYELNIGTDPSDYDTDDDGLLDWFEMVYGTNYTDGDTDGDGLPDYIEESGWIISYNYTENEVRFSAHVSSDPRLKDTDGDGLEDSTEYKNGLNPRSIDTNGDGVQDEADEEELVSYSHDENYWIETIPESDFVFYDFAVDSDGYAYIIRDYITYTYPEKIIEPGLVVYDSDGSVLEREGKVFPHFNLLKEFNITTRAHESPGALMDLYAYENQIHVEVDDSDENVYISGIYAYSDAFHALFVFNTTKESNNISLQMDYFFSTYSGSPHVYWDPAEDIVLVSENLTIIPRSHIHYPYPQFSTILEDVYVQLYNRTSKLGEWGKLGDDYDEFNDIVGIAVDRDREILYIADNRQGTYSRVAKFNYTGHWLGDVPTSQTGPLNFTGVGGAVAVDGDGYIYVASVSNDAENRSIHIFDPNGVLSQSIELWKSSDGPILPWAHRIRNFVLDLDAAGNIYYAYNGITASGNSFMSVIKLISNSSVINGPNSFPDDDPDWDNDGLENSNETAGWDVTFTNSSGTYTVHATSDPLMNDTDFDGLTDYQEHNLTTNPRDPDTDDDGLSDFQEWRGFSPKTNPKHHDTDGDGLPDGTEVSFGSDPTNNDTDNEGLSDLEEFAIKSNPRKSDSDNDGANDKKEKTHGSSLKNPDSDNDFMFDGVEYEVGTDPQTNDTDNDGIFDGDEIIYLTDPLNNDTDNDNLPDGMELELGIDPRNNDTDNDGVPDSTELEWGTNPWLNDTDGDGIPDNQDTDSNCTQVGQVILAYDSDNHTQKFAEDLAKFTNVTTVTPEDLIANHSSSPYIVLVGRPDDNGSVGELVSDLLQDAGDTLSKMIESDEHRLATRHGIWNATQTIVLLSHPVPMDHLRVLEILRSKTITIQPDYVVVNYTKSMAFTAPSGGDTNHTAMTYNFFEVDEIDTLKQTDSTIVTILEDVAQPLVEMYRYNSSTTPFNLTHGTGLEQYELDVGKYLELIVSQDIQNATGDIVEGALIQMYYRNSDLDKTGDGEVNDRDDIDENSLSIYYLNETTGIWTKITEDLNWIHKTGVNTSNINLYGENYSGYVWAYVDHFSLFGLSGRPFNEPPDVSGAYPSVGILWPPDHRLVDVTIEGVTDPDGDNFTITITGITSDEPTVSSHSAIDRKHAPDAFGVGTDKAGLRAERLGRGNGRVYEITFTAVDEWGADSVGSVCVCVPHDNSTWDICIDDGQVYDATDVNYALEPKKPEPPTTMDDHYSIEEDETLAVAAPGVLSNDADPDGDELSAVLVKDPDHGNLVFSPDGSFEYTPDQDWYGVDGFSYRASDGRRTSRITDVTITVTPVNDPPTISTIPDQEMCENTTMTLEVTASDVDADTLVLSVTSLPSFGSFIDHGDGSGCITFQPMVGEMGIYDSIIVHVEDSHGLTASTQFTMTVLLFNEPPDVSGAYPSVGILWPPDHRLVDVTIEGVTDPDGDNFTITITGITSDEPTGKAPDAWGLGENTAKLRAERTGKGNGRVYKVIFQVNDGKGRVVEGSVRICVPHDVGKDSYLCIDDGQIYDATKEVDGTREKSGKNGNDQNKNVSTEKDELKSEEKVKKQGEKKDNNNELKEKWEENKGKQQDKEDEKQEKQELKEKSKEGKMQMKEENKEEKNQTRLEKQEEKQEKKELKEQIKEEKKSNKEEDYEEKFLTKSDKKENKSTSQEQ